MMKKKTKKKREIFITLLQHYNMYKWVGNNCDVGARNVAYSLRRRRNTIVNAFGDVFMKCFERECTINCLVKVNK